MQIWSKSEAETGILKVGEYGYFPSCTPYLTPDEGFHLRRKDNQMIRRMEGSGWMIVAGGRQRPGSRLLHYCTYNGLFDARICSQLSVICALSLCE